MEDNRKHNIFSKEELFKLIDEKKSLPPEADDFDKEAFEGLGMVTDRGKLDKLDESIDEALRREAAKASKKKTMYFLAAAASLMLIIGLFFLLKDNLIENKESSMAENIPAKTGEAAVTKEISEGKEEHTLSEPPADKQVVKEEYKGKEAFKEGAKLDEEVAAKNQESFASDVTTVNVPAVEAENKITLAQNEKSDKGETAATRHDANLEEKKAQGGKSGKDDGLVADEQPKRAMSKKEADKKQNQAADEKEKNVRYESNTVWTSTGADDEKSKQVVDALKKKPEEQKDTKAGGGTGDNRNQPVNATATTTTGNAAPAQTQGGLAVTEEDADQSKTSPQKSAEVVVSAQQKTNQGPASKKRKTKYRSNSAKFGESTNAPAEKTPSPAGYAYYAQSSTRSFTSPEYIGGDEALQKFVKENLKISSPDKTGTIVAEFLIDKNGGVDANSIKIITPLKNCDTCSKDVIELVKNMPKWKPATENGLGKEYLQKLSVLYDSKMTKK